MKFSAPSPIPDAPGTESPGLTPEHREALGRAGSMIAEGHDATVAVDHLVLSGMPRVVAKVLVKQIARS